MKTLLSVIRDPEKARNFIGFVARLARDLSAKLHLLYVEEVYEYTIGQPPASNNYTDENQAEKVTRSKMIISEHLREVLHELQSDIDTEYSLELDSILNAISGYVASENPQLVILEGSEHKSFMYKITSNDEIIDEVNGPLMIIPVDAYYKPFQKIIFISADESRDVPSLNYILKLFSLFSPEIRVLHHNTSVQAKNKLVESGFESMLRLSTGYSNISVQHLIDIRSRNIVQLAKEILSEFDADLIVMMKGTRNFLQKMISSDPSAKLMKATDRPVMIFRD
jgi:nucleotide-binding universal stress UspA family protein